MRKKLLATVLAASMVLAMAPVLPANTSTVASAEETASTTNGVDFSAIETQPVLKYTFDSADELPLTGEANIADGVLNLATSATNNVTYATLPDLTSYDFSNGVTLVADVNVKGYTSDWTSIFMVGDGTVGGAGEDATAIYHLSQGFSSVGGVTGNYYEGYFGNAISAPYTWDYFNTEANRNTWNTIAVTISKDNMITYINGVKVQEAAADYTNVLQAFKVAKNNYLGTSYWSADPDFVGSMDNVGIYTTALSADDMAKLTTASAPTTPSTPTTPDDDTTADVKKDMTVKVTAKKNAKKVTGTVSVKKATVKVKVGKKAYKKATVNGKNFTLKCAKLTKGTKVTVKVTKSGYKAVTKTVTVK